eukprot:Blabericola_migrator_1__13322@NODE_937_length_5973_cov_17_376736_g651_i0_p1_GENE_NODE_937_length_5973_cov_17_376736_g651_i0NODE_937_length_5973_cov_17_376736_g651_i0_p1_ORF_typecomplete_len274_score51_41AraC_binding_2/PF14525_6/0_14_NODE_937_length_5973_cov_17_376736_g651_i037614582
MGQFLPSDFIDFLSRRNYKSSRTMTCLRSVVSSKPFRLDAKSGLGVLTVMIPGLVSVAPNTAPLDTQGGMDAATETFRELFNSLAQQLGTEDILPHFQAAVGAAAEEIKALAVETTAPEKEEILVRHLRDRLDEAGLTSQWEKALATTLSQKSWLSIIGGWARGKLDKALQLGTKVAPGKLLSFVSLLGMMDALPLASGNDGMTDGETGDSDTVKTIKSWIATHGQTLLGAIVTFDVILFACFVHVARSTTVSAQKTWLIHHYLVDPRNGMVF